jgi:prevent-host-death family protein
MKTVNASHFKAHFGSVLDEADKKPVRIARRGRPAAILVSEKDYRKLAEKDEGPNQKKKAAVKRLFETIENTTPEFSEEGLRASVKGDPRGEAIVEKYLRKNS